LSLLRELILMRVEHLRLRAVTEQDIDPRIRDDITAALDRMIYRIDSLYYPY